MLLNCDLLHRDDTMESTARGAVFTSLVRQVVQSKWRVGVQCGKLCVCVMELKWRGGLGVGGCRTV